MLAFENGFRLIKFNTASTNLKYLLYIMLGDTKMDFPLSRRLEFDENFISKNIVDDLKIKMNDIIFFISFETIHIYESLKSTARLKQFIEFIYSNYKA